MITSTTPNIMSTTAKMTAATTATSATGTSSLTRDDQKYGKRRHQKQRQQQHRAMVLVAVTCIVLIFTWHSLSSDLMAMQGQLNIIPPNPVLRQQQQQQQQRDTPKGKPWKSRPTKKKVEPKEATSFLEKARNLLRDPSKTEMEDKLAEMDSNIQNNVKDEIRWSLPELLVSLDPEHPSPLLQHYKKLRQSNFPTEHFFKVHRNARTPMKWESEPEATQQTPPRVDFTQHSYEYPDKLTEPPAHLGDYPPLEPLADIMNRWPQDDIDHPPTPFKEVLIHFDYQNPDDMAAAENFRDSKLPFKLVNVPEVSQAGLRWTDEYLSDQFDTKDSHVKHAYKAASGTCQESPDNFFAFFTPQPWRVGAMGIPPTRNNDWTFHKWVKHARYADSVSLSPQQPHFYWQAGVDKEERTFPKKDWTFISRDLPGFSSPTKTFFVFEPESQKGIQCRFGERGVTAATHFDAGRNMVAMVTGAKRYILSPPNQCRNLGIVTARGNAIFRHSLLNFGHINHLNDQQQQNGTNMSDEERAWLERSGQALAIDTVLKAGEVLYIPSHWFHYITSLQKSAQCNVRSGVDNEGDAVFGGKADVGDWCEIE
jgi:hypothetical protein